MTKTRNKRPQALGPRMVAMMLFDFDGVLTDNRVWLSEEGVESVCCNRADGLGFNLLREAGIRCMIVSTEVNPVVTRRAEKLRLEVVQAVADKGAAVRDICLKNDIEPRHVAFVGNDLNDLPALAVVGIRICPKDAAQEVRAICSDVLRANGGEGVVREIAAGLGKRWIAWR